MAVDVGMTGGSVALEAEGMVPRAIIGVVASPELSKHQRMEEIRRCSPGLGRNWASYFATRYAKTSDERGRIATIPAFEYLLEKCRAFQDGVDYHGEKTRQMTITWTTASNYLGWIMFGHNNAGFVTSRKEKAVDDGGSRSTTFSIVGKMRHIYQALPEWMRLLHPVNFSHLRVDCPATNSYVMGEGASGEGGRSGTFGRACVDEAAFITGEGWWRALRSACPEGVGMDSTPNGKANIFARFKFPEAIDPPHGFRMLRYHWTRHPLRKAGLYYDENKRPRSPWYDRATRGLTLDEIAREFDISYQHSAAGLIWPEYDEDKHLSWDVVYDPTLPLYFGMDFGMGAATTVVFGQVHGRELWIIGDYEAWNMDAREHAPAIAAVLSRITGGRVGPEQLDGFGDPAGNARELTNKNSTVIRAYQELGFKRLVSAPQRTKKDRVRLVRRKFSSDHVHIHQECLAIKRHLPDYRYRTDDMGYVLADVIQENSSTHIADAIQYLATGVFEMDDEGRSRAPMADMVAVEPVAFRSVEAVRPVPIKANPFRPYTTTRKDF